MSTDSKLEELIAETVDATNARMSAMETNVRVVKASLQRIEQRLINMERLLRFHDLDVRISRLEEKKRARTQAS